MKTDRYRIPQIDTNADYVQFKLRFNRRANKSANMFLSFSFYESVIKKKIHLPACAVFISRVTCQVDKSPPSIHL